MIDFPNINALTESVEKPFTEIERQEADQYLNSLHELVDELYDALQSMTFSEDAVAQGHLLHSRSPKFKGLHYGSGESVRVFEQPVFQG